MTDTEQVRQLGELIDNCRRLVVFTGAGISTESGIPDFRSPGGFWSRYQPIEFSDFVASAEMRRESWRRKLKADEAFGNAQPNRGHRAVADLFARETASAVITQNIDGLHQASGIAHEYVIELHGNATYAACLDCAKRFELGPILAAFELDETLPVCDQCRGMVKTATISFGQAMPEREVVRAQEEALSCDLFLVLGSSLVVYPAAGLPMLAKQHGAFLVIINRDATDQDALADLVIHASIGETLGQALDVD